MKTLISAMALHQAKPIEAVAASTSVPEQTEALITTSVPSLLEKLTGMDIPTNHMTKLVCNDPWVSFIVTVITIIGVKGYFLMVFWVPRMCRRFLKFAYDVVRVCMGKIYSLLVRGVSRSKRLIPLILSQSGWMLFITIINN